jgi:hypothetical protein
VSRGQRGGTPTVGNLSFLAGAATFLSRSSSFILTRAEWTPFQIHCYSENLTRPGIEHGTSESAARNSDHRGGHHKVDTNDKNSFRILERVLHVNYANYCSGKHRL